MKKNTQYKKTGPKVGRVKKCESTSSNLQLGDEVIAFVNLKGFEYMLGTVDRYDSKSTKYVIIFSEGNTFYDFRVRSDKIYRLNAGYLFSSGEEVIVWTPGKINCIRGQLIRKSRKSWTVALLLDEDEKEKEIGTIQERYIIPLP